MKDRLKHILKNLDAYFAGLMFAITLAIVVVNVFMRYFVGHVLPWGEEVATAGMRNVVQLLTDLIIVVLNSYITYLSVQFIISSKVKTMPILKISSVYLNASLFIGFGLMAIYSLVNMIQDARKMLKKEGE